MNPPKAVIIILNWNGWRDTIECMESLYQITYPCYDVIVVDNGSEDESVKRIREYAEGKMEIESKFFRYDISNKPIRYVEYTREMAEMGKTEAENFAEAASNRKLIVIRNEKNYNFSEGNNIGMRYALKTLDPEYILLLNNDTVVERSFLAEMIGIGEGEKEIGVIGPKIYYYDYGGRRDVINFAGGRLRIWLGRSYHIGINSIDNGEYDETNEVDYVQGSCFLIKKEAILKSNTLLNPFLFGWDEIDWCLKIRKAQFKIFYAPRAKIWHKVGASLGGAFGYVHLYYFIRSRLIFMDSNASGPQKITFLPFFLMDTMIRIAIISLRERNLSSISQCMLTIFKAIKDFWRISRHNSDLNI